MIFRRINRTAPEQVFGTFQANAASIVADQVAQLELTAASVDGVKIIQPASANLLATVGVVDAAIANGDFGLVQVYGYRSTSKIGPTDSTQTSLGQALTPVAGQNYFSTITSLSMNGTPIAVLLESLTTGTSSNTVSKKIFLRCM